MDNNSFVLLLFKGTVHLIYMGVYGTVASSGIWFTVFSLKLIKRIINALRKPYSWRGFRVKSVNSPFNVDTNKVVTFLSGVS